MNNTRVQLPAITLEQQKFLLNALRYYRICSVEFSYDSDEIVFNCNILTEIIDLQSDYIVEKE